MWKYRRNEDVYNGSVEVSVGKYELERESCTIMFRESNCGCSKLCNNNNNNKKLM